MAISDRLHLQSFQISDHSFVEFELRLFLTHCSCQIVLKSVANSLFFAFEFDLAFLIGRHGSFSLVHFGLHLKFGSAGVVNNIKIR